MRRWFLRVGWALLAGIICGLFSVSPSPAVEGAVIAPLAVKSLLLDGEVLPGGRLIVVGERGHILYSDDRGNFWQQAAVPTRATLTAVFFHDDTTGWAVGHDAVILMTRDAGVTWERIYDAAGEEKPLLDGCSLDGKNAVAIGAYSFFLTTGDGGKSWFPRPFSEDSEQDAHLNRFARAESGKLYIAAEGGRIYRSDDGTGTWRLLLSPYEGSFFGVLPLSGEALLVFGLRGHLFRSEDAGETWQKIETGTTAMLNSGMRLADGRLVIVGLAGTLLVSRDEGLHFAMVQQPDRKGISAVIPAGDKHLVLIGEGGVRKIPVDF
ncbi:MAG: YCF48-related protein [Pseudomonadota bacterium]